MRKTLRNFIFIGLFFCSTILRNSAQQIPGFGDRITTPMICEPDFGHTDEEAFQNVSSVCGIIGYNEPFILAICSNTDQCKSDIQEAKSYLFCHPSIIPRLKALKVQQQKLAVNDQGDWDLLCSLCHEIAHLALQHLRWFQHIRENVQLPDLELAADQYAGAALYRLGASIAELKQSFYTNGVSENANIRHASRQQRIAAALRGYALAAYPDVKISDTSADMQINHAIDLWINRDYMPAVKIFKSHRDQQRSWFYLGIAAQKGIGMSRDNALAKGFLKRSADSGNPYGQFALATLILAGKSKDRNLPLAFDYMQKAAAQFEPRAMMAISIMYLQGDGCEQNNQAYINALVAASRQDIPEAHFILGNLYREGKYVERDLARALEYLKRAAIFANADAQFILATMYEDGIDCEKNTKLAAYWYKKAAKQSHGAALQACKRLQITQP